MAENNKIHGFCPNCYSEDVVLLEPGKAECNNCKCFLTFGITIESVKWPFDEKEENNISVKKKIKIVSRYEIMDI